MVATPHAVWRVIDANTHRLAREEELALGNHCNGHKRKRVLTGTSSVELSVPRGRAGRFEPQLVEKWVRRLPGFDEKVISLYARDLTIPAGNLDDHAKFRALVYQAIDTAN